MKRFKIYEYTIAVALSAVLPPLSSAQYTGTANLCHEGGSIFINEVSNGPAGTNVQEYIEFVVVGSPDNPTAPVDLTGWIIDDNNFPGAGQGNAAGYMSFGDCYNAVPPGSIIVVYNEDDSNLNLPPDDPRDDDADGVYIIPHSHPCMDACSSNPNTANSNPNYCPCENPFDLPQEWHLNFRNAGDVIQVRDVCETLVHAIHWGGVELVQDLIDSPVDFNISAEGQSGKVILFANTNGDDWNAPSNFENPDFTNNESPGIGNNAANIDFIERIRAGQSPCSGSIADCRDTDAGDLILPPDAPSASLPLQLCSGEDLGAFSSNYEAPDEFEPDAVGFTFEYAFLLTENNAPEFTILDFSSDGNFALDQVPAGNYLIWGLSYTLTNGSIDLSSLLNNFVGSIAEINAFTSCGLSLNLDNLTSDNTPVELIITDPSNSNAPESILGCPLRDGSIAVDLTRFNEEVNGGSGLPVNWYTDMMGNNLVEDPANFTTDTREVFVSVVDGCESSLAAVAVVGGGGPQPIINVLSEPGCGTTPDGAIELTVNGGATPPTIDWNIDEFDGQMALIGLSGGFYAVTVTDISGCTDSTSVLLPSPGDLRLICQTQNQATSDLGNNGAIAVEFEGSDGPFTLSWEGPDSGSQELMENQKLSVNNLSPGFYTFFLQDVNGCVTGCQAEIIIENSSRVVLPNAFSPNGDGVNDFFTIQSTDEALTNVLLFQVYDRWGELVFERQNLLPGDANLQWDGTFNGRELGPGIFVYYAELSFNDGTVSNAKGDILLVR